VKVMITIS